MPFFTIYDYYYKKRFWAYFFHGLIINKKNKIMKKNLFNALVALFVLTSCAGEYREEVEPTIINKTDTVTVDNWWESTRTLAGAFSTKDSQSKSSSTSSQTANLRNSENGLNKTFRPTATLDIALAQDTIEVEEGTDMYPTLTAASTPTSTPVTKGEEEGNSIAQSFSFSDGQQANGLIEHLYAVIKDSRNNESLPVPHFEISNLVFKEADVEDVNNNISKVTLNFEADYASVKVNTGDELSGKLCLAPYYYKKVLSNEPAVEPGTGEYSYKVDTLMEDAYNFRYTYLTITRTNPDGSTTQMENFHVLEAASCKTSSEWELHVSDENPVKEELVLIDEIKTSETEGNLITNTVEKRYKMKTSFKVETGGLLEDDTDSWVKTSSFVWSDPETGYTLEYNFSGEVVLRKGEIVDLGYEGKDIQGVWCPYIGSYVQTYDVLVNGKVFYTYTRTAHLWYRNKAEAGK